MVTKTKYRWKCVKNHRGRPKLQYIQQLINDQGCDSYMQMSRTTEIEKIGN